MYLMLVVSASRCDPSDSVMCCLSRHAAYCISFGLVFVFGGFLLSVSFLGIEVMLSLPYPHTLLHSELTIFPNFCFFA